MKETLLLTLIAVTLTVSACTTAPQKAEVNDPSVYYALKGEEMIKKANQPSKKSTNKKLSAVNSEAL